MASQKILKKEKEAQVKQCINAKKVDLAHIRSLALTPYGYCNSEMRRKLWPKLLGLSEDKTMPRISQESLLAHRDYNQVVLDVNRTVKRFPKAMKESNRSVLQDQLITLIMKVLVNNPELHYYQGFHDVCITFLLILGKNISFVVMDSLSRNHLRDFMDVDMRQTRSMLNYLYPLLHRADPELETYMQTAEVGTIFALSWLITWYSHVLEDEREIVRLYDFFLASHPLMPIYLAVSIVTHRRDEIFNTEQEMCYIHVLLSKVPCHLPYEELIQSANQLFDQFPPTELADDAAFEYEKSKAMKNYTKFEKLHGIQSVPSVTSFRRTLKNDASETPPTSQLQSAIVKVTMWTFTAAVGAAIIAMQYAMSNT